MQIQGFEIEPEDERAFRPCACCGGITKKAWGYIHFEGATEAAFFVEWTVGKVLKHGAMFDLIVGRWGDDSSSGDRVAVSVDLQYTPQGPQFMVVDASKRPFSKNELVGNALDRSDVIGTPFAKKVFKLLDVIWLGDERIKEVSSPLIDR